MVCGSSHLLHLLLLFVFRRGGVSRKDAFVLAQAVFWTPTGKTETAFLSATLTFSNFGAAVQQLDTLGSIQSKVSLVVFDSKLMIDGCRTQAVSLQTHAEQEGTEHFQKAEIFVLTSRSGALFSFLPG